MTVAAVVALVNGNIGAGVATKTTLNLSKGQTLSATVDGSVSVSFEMPCGLSAFVVYLGSSSAKISAN